MSSVTDLIARHTGEDYARAHPFGCDAGCPYCHILDLEADRDTETGRAA